MTQPCQGQGALARAGTGGTHIGLNYHGIFPEHSAAAIGNEMVSLIGLFISRYINYSL